MISKTTSRAGAGALSALVLLGGVLGCDSGPHPSEPPVALAADQTDHQLQVIMAMPGFKAWWPLDAAGDKAKRPAELDGTGSIAAVVTAQGRYLVEFDQDVMERALNTAGVGGALAGSKSLRGWSNGVDNRIRRTGTNLVPEVGQVQGLLDFSRRCTGTLIGERIVRTAAHCIVEHTTGGGLVPFAGDQWFYFKRDGEDEIAVAAQSETAIFGGNYIGAGCATSTASNYYSGYNANFNTCTWHDYAYIILPENWWWDAGSVNWMGYLKLTSNDLNMQLRMTQYPGCHVEHKPIGGVGCVNGGQYEDRSTTCDVKAWTASTSKFRSDCDASPGASGGPAWKASTRQLIAHAQTESCQTCTGNPPPQFKSAPNYFLGHDTFLFNLQESLRQDFP